MYFWIGDYPELKQMPAREKKEQVTAFYKACPSARTYQMLGVMLPMLVLIIAGFAVLNVVFKLGGAIGGAIAGAAGGGLAQVIFGPLVFGGPVRKLFVEYWNRKAD